MTRATPNGSLTILALAGCRTTGTWTWSGRIHRSRWTSMWLSSRWTRRSSVTQPSAGGLPRSSRIAPASSSSRSWSSCLRRRSCVQRHAAGRVRPAAWRCTQLRRLKQLLHEREDELAGAMRDDLGKPPAEGWVTELRLVQRELSHMLGHLDRWMRPDHVHVPVVLQPARAKIVSEPFGVALVIAPWNYPVQLLLLPMAAAIAAGNAVVGKPSELAPASSAAVAKLLPSYLDGDAVAIVEGGPEAAQALLAERFDYIFYTGSARIGHTVMEAAAKHLTPVTLELGGKSPAIVDKHVNLDI